MVSTCSCRKRVLDIFAVCEMSVGVSDYLQLPVSKSLPSEKNFMSRIAVSEKDR